MTERPPEPSRTVPPRTTTMSYPSVCRGNRRHAGDNPHEGGTVAHGRAPRSLEIMRPNHGIADTCRISKKTRLANLAEGGDVERG